MVIFFNKGKLKGNLTTSSNLLNLDELMMTSESTAPSSTAKTEKISIPTNVDLTLNTNCQKRLSMERWIFKILSVVSNVSDAKAMMKNVKMQLLKGDVTLNGAF